MTVDSKKEYIDLTKELKPDTLTGIRIALEEAGFILTAGARVFPQAAEDIVMILKKVEDNALVFPRGKWATIQRLQLLISEVRGFKV